MNRFFAPIGNAIYAVIVGAFHRAFKDIGAIPDNAQGSEAEQVRAVLRPVEHDPTPRAIGPRRNK